MDADYAHKDSLTATEYVGLNKKNELLLMYNQTLLKENQELKKQLHEASLNIQEMTERDIYCPSSCDKLEKLLKENEQLAKDKLEYLTKYAKMLSSQDKFIKYLEDKKIFPIKGLLNSIGDKNPDYNMFKNKLDNYKEILQKYREMVGDDRNER